MALLPLAWLSLSALGLPAVDAVVWTNGFPASAPSSAMAKITADFEAQAATESASEDAPHSASRMLVQAVDWRGATLRPVEEQGSYCGNCWAMAATHAVDDQLRIESRHFAFEPDYTSTEDATECSFAYAGNGCNGGPVDAVFRRFAIFGSVQRQCKVFGSQDYTQAVALQNAHFGRTCAGYCYGNGESYQPGKRRLTGYFTVTAQQGMPAIMDRLTAGHVGVLGMQIAWDFYGWMHSDTANLYLPNPNTVYCGSSGCNKGYIGYHAMEIVGWGHRNTRIYRKAGSGYFDATSSDYLILKNSWGTNFPCEGFVYLSVNAPIFYPVAFPCFANCPSGTRSSRRLDDTTGNETAFNETLSDYTYVLASVNDTSGNSTGPVVIDPTTDPVAEEVVWFVGNYTAPVCTGNVVVSAAAVDVFSMTVQIVSGALFQLMIHYELPPNSTCVDSSYAYDVGVHLDPNGTFTLQTFELHNSAQQTPPPLSYFRQIEHDVVTELHKPSIIGLAAALGATLIATVAYVVYRKRQRGGKLAQPATPAAQPVPVVTVPVPRA